MIRLIAATAVAGIAFSAASTAQAGVLQLAHKPFNRMTTGQKITYLKKQRFHDKSIIRYWEHRRQLQMAYSSAQVQWAKKSLRIVQRNLHALTQAVHQTVAGVVGSVKSALLCIHRYEGSWSDPGSPYWGGLQMDMNFQSAYGPEFLKRWGTADHWPVWAQLTAGARAVKARGYAPWPNTARYCGLA